MDLNYFNKNINILIEIKVNSFNIFLSKKIILKINSNYLSKYKILEKFQIKKKFCGI